MRTHLAAEFIKGRGIEVGGLHFPLPVPPGVKVSYIDRMSLSELRRQNPGLDVKDLDIIVDNAETLDTIAGNTQDFLIANHVFEHCENPIKTLLNWWRVLRPNGVVFAAIPIKDHTFDRKRPITPFRHLIDDFELGPQHSAEAHYRDWYSNSELEGHTGEELESRVMAALVGKSNIHFHVWGLNEINELAEKLTDFCKFKTYHVYENGSEAIVIWVK